MNVDESTEVVPRSAPAQAGPGGARLLARSFYRELRQGGFDHNAVLAASNEILDLVAQELRDRAAASPRS